LEDLPCPPAVTLLRTRGIAGRVERLWMPKPLRCLIVGENPGDVTSEYFYEPPPDPKNDRVRVRRVARFGVPEAPTSH
jgi:hypothetical protein